MKWIRSTRSTTTHPLPMNNAPSSTFIYSRLKYSSLACFVPDSTGRNCKHRVALHHTLHLSTIKPTKESFGFAKAWPKETHSLLLPGFQTQSNKNTSGETAFSRPLQVIQAASGMLSTKSRNLDEEQTTSGWFPQKHAPLSYQAARTKAPKTWISQKWL